MISNKRGKTGVQCYQGFQQVNLFTQNQKVVRFFRSRVICLIVTLQNILSLPMTKNSSKQHLPVSLIFFEKRKTKILTIQCSSGVDAGQMNNGSVEDRCYYETKTILVSNCQPLVESISNPLLFTTSSYNQNNQVRPKRNLTLRVFIDRMICWLVHSIISQGFFWVDSMSMVSAQLCKLSALVLDSISQHVITLELTDVACKRRFSFHCRIYPWLKHYPRIIYLDRILAVNLVTH